jgi:hypothetical protein
VTIIRKRFVLLTPLVEGRTPAILSPTALPAPTEAVDAPPDLVDPEVPWAELGFFDPVPALDWLPDRVPVPADEPLLVWQLP